MEKVNRRITMTEGPLFKNILLFSLPLMLSNVLQVLFNMSDIAVVGRFSGAEALGSVGSCATLVALFTGLMIGMGSGINSMAARFIGAKDKEKLQKTVSSSFVLSLAYGIIVMAIGLIAVKSVLTVMKTKPELMDGAVLYLKVYLIGTPALAIYNYGNGVLSAAGDSKRPLFYLLSAGVLNIILNLIFVICFNMGVLGVALASIISQYLSAALILIRLFFCKEDYALSFRNFKLDFSIGKSVFLLGFSAGLQNAIFSVANLFIQSAVNTFDTVMVEGNSAAANGDTLVYDMMAAFYIACTSFIAQNYGRGNKKRILDSYKICLLLSFIVALIGGGLLLIFGRQFLSIFSSDELVVESGMKRVQIMAYSFFISAFMDNTIAASRGLGKTIIPTIIVILGSCVFRIIWIYTVFAYFKTIPSLYLLYAFSWTITAVLEIIYFVHAYKKATSIFKTESLDEVKNA